MKSYLNEEMHVANIGELIEEAETNLRCSIEEIYIMKSKEVINVYYLI